MPSILIICTANQCRSPLAEVLLQRQLTERAGNSQWTVESAGTWAAPARPAHPQMRKIAEEVGLDLSQHRARNVENLALHAYDLILTMEQSHKEALQVEFPTVRKRIYQLTEMVGLSYDIADPIGGTIDDFRGTLHELKRLMTYGLPRIIEMASAQSVTTTLS